MKNAAGKKVNKRRIPSAKDVRHLENSPYMDAVWYRETYFDQDSEETSAALHYLKTGASQGRNPGPNFDTNFYLQEYPDVKAENINPLLHYILHGAKEGRKRSKNYIINIDAPFSINLDRAQAAYKKHATVSNQDGRVDISIIIPVHNRLDLSVPCLTSIYECTSSKRKFEIIIVDDASTDNTFEFVKTNFPRVRIIQNAKRKSFGENMNMAALQAKGRYLCLLNNDTVVLKDWLDLMVSAIENDPSIGIVGNRHLWPSNDKINHGGMAFDKRYEPIHVYVGQDTEYPPALIDQEFQILTAACWVVPTKLFNDMKGFDLLFKNGFEDVDFCLRVKEQGLKVWYVGKSVIYHYGQSTPGRTTNDNENARRFHVKWRGKIVPDLHKFTETPPWLVQHRMSASRVSGSEADVHFANQLDVGNSFTWVTSQLAIACEKIGMKVSMPAGKLDASIEPEQQSALNGMMSRRPSTKSQLRWGHFWKPYLQQPLAGEINAEIIAVNYRYEQQQNQAYDFWMRHTVTNPYRKLPISEYCSDMLVNIGVDSEKCRVLPLGFSPEIITDDKIDTRFQNYQFVFLAITNSHDPYRYGTDVLLKAFEKAFAGRKDIVLILKDYGSASSLVDGWVAKVQRVASVIHLKEFVSKSDLIGLYRCADAFVAPFRGEGFGMKIIDACAVGLPVIAPHYGGPCDFLLDGSFYPIKYQEVPVGECLDAQEGVLPPYSLWCEPDIDDLMRQMVLVSGNAKNALKVALIAKTFVLENFTWEKAAVKLQGALSEFSVQRDTVIRPRAKVASKAISLIMPTFRRPDALRKTLEGYRNQTHDKSDWEIVVVDDGSGPGFDSKSIVKEYAGALPIKYSENNQNRGPGKARETGIDLADGEIVAFVGDDIVPHEKLVSEHLLAHRGLKSPRAAVLGYIGWDKDLQVTELMDFITGDGGHQFSYFAADPYRQVPPGYFYTSNVSIHRDFLTAEEEIFNTHFKGYGCEDSELGLRLARKGMTLHYNPNACAFHNHPMSDEYIYNRQYKVGKALLTLCMLQPDIMDDDKFRKAEMLELLQFGQKTPLKNLTRADPLDLMRLYEEVGLNLGLAEGFVEQLRDISTVSSRKMRALSSSALKDSAAARHQIFALRLELAEFCGMADAWFEGTGISVSHSVCASMVQHRLMLRNQMGGPQLSGTHLQPDNQSVELLTEDSVLEITEERSGTVKFMDLIDVAHFCNVNKDGIWYNIECSTADSQIWLSPFKNSIKSVSLVLAVAAEQNTRFKIYWRYGNEEFDDNRAVSFDIGPNARVIRWNINVTSKERLQLRIDPSEDICQVQLNGVVTISDSKQRRRRLRSWFSKLIDA